MADAEVKATDGARKRAEEAGLDLADIGGTGADGQVTAHDVDKAASELKAAEEEAAKAAAERAEVEAESRQLVRVKVNPELVAEGTTTVSVAGRTFPDRRPVTRADFEENLKPAKDTEGRQVLHIERKVG